MLAIHPQARTTPAVRAEITRSPESSGVLAKRYGVSTETIRKWRKRGPGDCQDGSARPHKLPWKASDEERAIVCALRRSTGLSLDDLTRLARRILMTQNRVGGETLLLTHEFLSTMLGSRRPSVTVAMQMLEGLVRSEPHVDASPCLTETSSATCPATATRLRKTSTSAS
jgi:DNA-binding transcriptional MerR regulator